MPQALGLLLFTLGAPVAVVNAVAVGALGTALVQIGVSIGLSLLASLLTPRPQPPKPSDVKNNIRETTQPRSRSYGRVRVGGTVAFIAAYDNKLVKVICHGQGPISAVVGHFIDDNLVTLDGNGQVNEYKKKSENKDDRVVIETRLGGVNQQPYASVMALTGNWSMAFRGDGMSHSAMVLRQPLAEDFQKVFPQGVSTSYTQVQDTQIVYDPRTGNNAYSDNVALCIRDFITSRWGLRLDADVVSDADSWSTAAYLCDAAIPLKAGGAEKRYRLAMTYMMNERPADVLARMLDVCDGQIFPTPDGGLTLKVGVWEEPTVTITEDDIISVTGLTRGSDVLTRFNTIRAQYTSPDHNYEEIDADPWVNDDLVLKYGETSKDVQLYGSPSHGQTRRIMKLLDRRLNPEWRMTIATNLAGLAVMGHRFIRVQIPMYGVNDTFEIQGQPTFVLGDESTITGLQMEIVSMRPEAYSWDPAIEEGEPPLAPEGDDDQNDDMPIPSGFDVNVAPQTLNGQTVSIATFKANKPEREDLGVFFEVSSDGQGSWAEVPHASGVYTADYGPLLDGVTYFGRARTIRPTGKRGDPSSTKQFTSVSPAIQGPVDLQATVVSPNVNVSARAPNDPNVSRLQFRRGTTSQTFAQAEIISTQICSANDVRQVQDTPGSGTWRYWAATLNSQGLTSTSVLSIDRTV